jgi:dTDP-4-dehydrorhamnose reductase
MEKIKKKVLVLGSSGMLGHILTDSLKADGSFRVYNLSRKKKIDKQTIICDVLNYEHLEQVIKEIQPNHIINSIGILVNESIKNPTKAVSVNSKFPHRLKEIAEKYNASVFHLSTDCVFDGSSGGYDEDSIKTPIDVYGRTKDIGEIISENHLTIRTSIIGPELKNDGDGLFLWIIKNKNLKVDGYEKSIWSGLTTIELSKAIIYCIKNDIKGLIHISSSPISKYKLLKLINQEFNLNIEIKKVDGKISDKSLKSKRKDFAYKIPSYKSMILEMKAYMESKNYKY